MQITLFLVLVYGVSWALFFLMRPGAAQGELSAFLAWLFPLVWSPTVIAVILTLSARGSSGLKQELKTRLRYQSGAGWWFMLAGVGPCVATSIALLIARSAGDGAPFVASSAVPMMIVLQVITGAAGEELGWRGFLLPRLGERFGETTAALAMGVLWALWHLPAFFFPGMPHQMMPLVSNLLFTACVGIFLALIFNRTGASVLATMLAHLALNVMFGIGGVSFSSAVFWRTMTVVYAALAVIAIMALRTPPHAAAQHAVPADR